MGEVNVTEIVMYQDNAPVQVYGAVDGKTPGTIIAPFRFFEVDGALRTWRIVNIEGQLAEMLRGPYKLDDFEFTSIQIDYDAGIVIAKYEPQV